MIILGSIIKYWPGQSIWASPVPVSCIWTRGARSRSQSHTLVPTISKFSSLKLLFILIFNKKILPDICLAYFYIHQTGSLQQAIGDKSHKQTRLQLMKWDVPYVHCTSYQKSNVYIRICGIRKIAKDVNTSTCMCVITIHVKTIAKLCVASPQLQVQTSVSSLLLSISLLHTTWTFRRSNTFPRLIHTQFDVEQLFSLQE